MPKQQPYLENFVPHLYQRQQLDVMIFAFIDAYKFAFPSITTKEAAQAFLKRYKIAEDLYYWRDIVTTYHRTLKDFTDAERQRNQQSGKSGQFQKEG